MSIGLDPDPVALVSARRWWWRYLDNATLITIYCIYEPPALLLCCNTDKIAFHCSLRKSELISTGLLTVYDRVYGPNVQAMSQFDYYDAVISDSSAVMIESDFVDSLTSVFKVMIMWNLGKNIMQEFIVTNCWRNRSWGSELRSLLELLNGSENSLLLSVSTAEKGIFYVNMWSLCAIGVFPVIIPIE